MNRKILMSLGAIVFVGAVVLGATGAFFSDSETSTGNTLTAGAIDLKIDNTSYVTSTSTGQLIASEGTTWTLRDLTIEKFFDFVDLKPGDIGEDTISLHVDNNDSYLCADITLTSDEENDLVEPEAEDGDTTEEDGELAEQVNFVWWADDGDNVYESDENLLPGGPLGALDVGKTTTVALADSDDNIWEEEGGPIPGNSVRYIGKAWCFGTITPDPVEQDGGADEGRSPLTDGTGFDCDGSSADNTAQTDGLTADVSFRAVQSRNNGDFQCVPGDQPEPVVTTLTLAKAVLPPEVALDTAFTLTADGPSDISGVEGDVSITNADVLPGVYALSETGGPDGATSRTWECSGNATAEVDNADGTATVTIAAGENVVCGITNNYPDPNDQ